MHSLSSDLDARDYARALEFGRALSDCAGFDEVRAESLARVQRYLGAESGAFFLLYRQPDGGWTLDRGASMGVSPEVHKAYIDVYSQLDPIIEYVNRNFPARFAQAFRLQDVIDYQHLVSSRYYEEFLEPGSIRQLFALAVRTRSGVVGLLGLHRPSSSRPFDRGDIARGELLVPLISNVLDRTLAFEWARRADAAIEALESDVELRPILVLDEAFRLLYASPEARERLGLAAGAAGSRLPEEITNTVRAMAADARAGLARTGRLGDGVTSIHVAARDCTAGGLRYFITLAPAATAGADESARQLGLTDRQIVIARQVSAGLSNKEIARQLGISVRTVENHLHAIYQALGVRNRTMLARLL